MTSLSPEQEPQQRRSGTTGVDEKLLVRDQDSISVIPNSPTKTIQCPGRGHDTGSGDGRAWGGGKEEDEGQDMGLTVLPVCEDVNIAAALGMGAFGNGRRQEERMFLEVMAFSSARDRTRPCSLHALWPFPTSPSDGTIEDRFGRAPTTRSATHLMSYG